MQHMVLTSKSVQPGDRRFRTQNLGVFLPQSQVIVQNGHIGLMNIPPMDPRCEEQGEILRFQGPWRPSRTNMFGANQFLDKG